LQFDFDSNQRYAITGSNGSGKSTLMQILAGLIHHNEGTIHHLLNGETIAAEKVYQFVSFTAPYVDMPDEFSFEELLLFHFQFKPIVDSKTVKELIELSGLAKSAQKQIRFYSSGMKQRARLVLSLFSDTPLLLLDEPCTNLDASGIKWYHDLLSTVSNKRLLVISSNDPQEYVTCDQILSIEDFKRF